MNAPLFLTTFFEQKKTLMSLLKEAHAGRTYYLFLTLSAFIVTLGFLVNNPVVTIGGVFIAPLPFPLLALGMGIVARSDVVIKQAFLVVVKSVLIVCTVAFLTSFLLGGHEVTEQMELASGLNISLFLIAFASGVIGTFSWVRGDIPKTLSGIAVNFSLTPLLVVSGIAIAFVAGGLLRESVALFVLNFFGVVVGSAIVFVFFGFSEIKKIEGEGISAEISNESKRV